jgi:ribosomal-protein-alanine N-acetyltransferase
LAFLRLPKNNLMQDLTESSITMRTARLELIAMNLASVEAELAGPDLLSALLGVKVPMSWPPGEYDRDALLYFKACLRGSQKGKAGWYSWYAINTTPAGKRQELMGAVGYLGPPVAGSVEIGYSLIPEARGQGFGAECARALVDRAFGFPEVRCVIAHTRGDANLASTKVLLGCGFRRVGPGTEPDLVRYQCDRAGNASDIECRA